jgi:hypothetical protein
LVIVNVPVTVQVVQVIVPVFVSVPAVYETVLEQVILNEAESSVPVVNVSVVQLNAAANVNVPEVLSANAAIALLLKLGVLVPTILIDKLVYVPLDDNVKLLRFNVVAAKVNAVVPKFNVPNQLAVVSTGIAVPDPVNVKLGALVAVPPEVDPTL